MSDQNENTASFENLSQGMSDDELKEFASRLRTAMLDTANQIKQERQATRLKDLQRDYELERNEIARTTGPEERVWRLSELKAKYRRLGLEVY